MDQQANHPAVSQELFILQLWEKILNKYGQDKMLEITFEFLASLLQGVIFRKKKKKFQMWRIIVGLKLSSNFFPEVVR